MKEEYNYTLSVPLSDLAEAEELLRLVEQKYPRVRVSRKPDRKDLARFYLCFAYSGRRTDNGFSQWFSEKSGGQWELFGPNYGVWGLS
jgi:hypothetical protein